MPQKVEQCEPFGYVDKYKLVTTDPAKLHVDIDRIEKWYKHMKLNNYFLPVKKENSFDSTLNDNNLSQKLIKDLGVVISAEFSWKSIWKHVHISLEDVLLPETKRLYQV